MRMIKDEAGDGAPLSEAIRRTLESDIASGALPPGTHLEESALAERFGASRTPVREALRQLASARVVELRPRRGAIVPQLDVLVVLEMVEAMAELEACCARLAARRLTEQDRRAIEEAFACSGAACPGGPDDGHHGDEQFHLSIHKASHNRVLEEQASALLRRLQPYRRLQSHLSRHVELAQAEHEALRDALLSGDGDRAAALARDHAQVQGQDLGDFMVLLRSRAASEQAV
ncbi:GntR family transcriptional regulator [Azospirillum thermophilum]|uniref:GntR family transcriptional regulator n=1 Tax=Azospirillum thermophilum TaxID=2202148 RepID=A0A2S2CV40_9PROT|nr:GntR family transcriptional regulator [Azospirillum thermophilum]AWK88383.1 GntR family transcriptional regulator [Azospirillum thermophilum]